MFFQPLTPHYNDIIKYCQELGYDNFDLTPAELEQLDCYGDGEMISPETRDKNIHNHLHFEIKRGLARRYSFELLLEGCLAAHKKFVQAQTENLKLSFDEFQALSQEAQLLPNDLQAATRASCFLRRSKKFDVKLTEANYAGFDDNQDCEVFLTEIAKIAIDHPKLMPIISQLTPEQRLLLTSLFWPHTHFRHMLFTEGGENMINEFRKGIEAKTFNFIAWKWRWLTNIMGFKGGPAAKYFNAETYTIVKMVINALENSVKNPEQSFLDNYLIQRAEMAGLTKLELNSEEHKLLGHIAAYGNEINILTPEIGQSILDGYLKHQKLSNDTDQLADQYKSHRENQHTISPTYVPALFNGAYLLFSNELQDRLPHSTNPLSAATIFICQTLTGIYSQPFDKRISCKDFAYEPNLKPILENWLHQSMQIQFDIKGAGVDVSLSPKTAPTAANHNLKQSS